MVGKKNNVTNRSRWEPITTYYETLLWNFYKNILSIALFFFLKKNNANLKSLEI